MPTRAGLDREAVVRAAADLLDEKAKPEITLAELASRLGVRTPSLYNHIGGLDDLHYAIALFATQELGARIAHAAIGKSGADALIAIGIAYREFAKSHPGLYLAALRAPGQHEADRAAVSDQILDVLRLVLEPFGLPPDEEINAMRAVRSLMHGFVSLELIGGFGLPVNVDQSFDYLLHLIVAGMGHASDRE